MADRVGQQLGNYRIIRLLGQGGFADVYLGEHHYLKSQAAIKVLQTRLSSTDSHDGFLKEAQTIARLSHPNIIRVLDFGIDEETPYLVMEYASNGTLRHRHSRGTALPLDTIVLYIKQVADALQYAHDERLIHRDVKPENMLVGRRNEILLSDFGIALTAQSSRSQRTQEAIGTVAYMSPEQIQGKPRPASDQYSLAVIAYEWLVGEPLFQGSFTELCTQHMFAAPPPLREKLEQASPEIERVLLKALDKDPKLRYERIMDFAHDLEAVSQGGPTIHMLPSSSQTSYATTAMDEEKAEDAARQNLTQGSYTTAAMSGSGEELARSLLQQQQGQKSSLPSAPFQMPSKPTPTTSQPLSQTTPTPTKTSTGPANPQQFTFHSERTVAQTGRPDANAPQPGGGARMILPPQPTSQVPSPHAQPQQQQQFAQGQPGQFPPAPQPQPQQPYYPQQGPGQHPQTPYGYGQGGHQQFPPQGPYPGNFPQQGGQPFGQAHQMGQDPFAQQQLQQQAAMPTPQRPPTPTHEDPTPPPARSRQEREEPGESAREKDEDLLNGMLGEWKWPILATLVGLVLFCLLYRFNAPMWQYTVPVILAVPLFFGGAFGPWVGLIVGGAGALLCSLFYPGYDTLHASLFHTASSAYEGWVPTGIFALTGLAAGLSMLGKRRHPSISSAVRAGLLTVIALAGAFGFILYREQKLQYFPTIGLIALLAVGAGTALLLIYSVAARLVDSNA